MIRNWKGAGLLVAAVAVIALIAVPIVAGAQGWGGMMGGGSGGYGGMMGGAGGGNGTTGGTGGYGGMMGGGTGGYGGMMGGGTGGYGGMMGGYAGNMWDLHNQELAAAAQVLGMSVEDVSNALAQQSIEQLAQSKGTTADAVWAATQQARTAYVGAQVQAGTITQAQADQLLSLYDSMGAMTLYGGAMMNTGACHGTGSGFAPTSQT